MKQTTASALTSTNKTFPLATDQYVLTDCILGYFTDPGNKVIAPEEIANIKRAIEANINNNIASTQI